MQLQLLTAATAVNNKPVSQSTADVVVVSKANTAAGDYFILNDGWTYKLYQLNVTGADTALAPETLFPGEGITLVNIDISADTTATQVGDRVVTAINAAQRIVAVNVTGTVTCTSRDWINTKTILPNREVVTNASFTVAQWSGSTQGFDLVDFKRTDDLWAIVSSTLTAAAGKTVAIRVWVMSVNTTRKWTPLGAGPDTTKGMLNAANAATSYRIGETQTNELVHTELLSGMSMFDRIFFEITEIDASTTVVDAFVASRGGARS